MQSSRTFQFSAFPRTNIPGFIKDLKTYNKIIKSYKDSNSINKERQVWWKIRPHIEYGTVEFRVCDIQISLNRTEMIVALVQALVHSIVSKNDFIEKDYNYEFLQDGLWKSVRYGLDCNVIDPYDEKIISMKTMIKKMLNYSKDSLRYFNSLYVEEYIEDILVNGPESYKQLKIYNESGFRGLKKYFIDVNNW